MIEFGSFSVGAILGTLGGVFLGHKLAMRREKHRLKLIAGTDFRESLLNSLRDVNSGKSQFEVTKSNFLDHMTLGKKYAATLSKQELAKFSLVFDDYIKWQSVIYDRDQSEILYETNDPEYLKYKSIDLQEYIDKLLKIIK